MSWLIAALAFVVLLLIVALYALLDPHPDDYPDLDHVPENLRARFIAQRRQR